jgi:signal transduction histidine kinase
MEKISSESIQVLVKTVQELSLARDLDSVMKVVRTSARKLTGADGATFVLREGDKCFYADEEAIGPLWKGSRFPMSACISGWVMLNRQPAAIEDIYADNRIPPEAYRPTFVKSLVMVPIRTIDPIGAIGNYWSKPQKPTFEQVWLLQSLADITSVTIENVYMYVELERRVKERTRQLEAANSDLEAFTYTVSHDLRAPLRLITCYADMLASDHAAGLTDDGMRITKKIIDGGRNMTALIDRLLHFFKSSKNELLKSRVSMHALVVKMTCEIKMQELNRHLEFFLNEIPDVEADHTLIQQVWANLLSNAVKYTVNKSKAIIEIGSHINENNIVYFVRDNGAGFDMQHYDKLFGFFQRLPESRQFEGSGIGLASVHRIITRHGGKVWAAAEPGVGATFFFSLPQ